MALAPLYSFDPCMRTGCPCGACPPYSTKPYAVSNQNVGPCSKCPGGGCSYCPAPVHPAPEPCYPCPFLPGCKPCPPCKGATVVRPIECRCDTVAIPCCRPLKCKQCPQYGCPQYPCNTQPCAYPGVPMCGGCSGCCGCCNCCCCMPIISHP